jgi:hypothetical protein
VPNEVVVFPVAAQPPVAFHPNDTCVIALLAIVNVIVLSCAVLPLHVPSSTGVTVSVTGTVCGEIVAPVPVMVIVPV